MARLRVLLLALLVLSSHAAAAAAQTTNSGAMVFVKTDVGPEVRGRLIDFSPETVTLLVREQRVSFPASRVQSIDLHGDSLKNGALIGASIYGGLALIGMSGDPQVATESWFLPVMLIQTGLGAAIGAGIDALHKGRTPLYRKSTTVSLTPTRKGAAIGVVLRF